jgi:hypothetical protein
MWYVFYIIKFQIEEFEKALESKEKAILKLWYN